MLKKPHYGYLGSVGPWIPLYRTFSAMSTTKVFTFCHFRCHFSVIQAEVTVYVGMSDHICKGLVKVQVSIPIKQEPHLNSTCVEFGFQ